MSTPEWLRPVSERFLGGNPGPLPWTVKVAVVLAAVCAVAAAGMVQVFGTQLIRGTVQEVSVIATAIGLVLLAVFAAATVRLVRHGWSRPPRVAGLVLGGLALLGLWAYGPAFALPVSAETDQVARFLAPRFAATAAAGFGLTVMLRTGSASSWLAIQRYRTGRTGGSGAPPGAG